MQRDYDKELIELMTKGDAVLSPEIKDALQIASVVRDALSEPNPIVFINSQGGTDAKS